MAQAQIGMSVEQKFTLNLLKSLENSSKCVIWPREKYTEVLQSVKSERKASSIDYYYLKKFDVLQCGDVERLVKKRKNENDPILYYVCAEEIYSVIQKAHINTGHGGRDKMFKELNKKYANITKDVLGLYKELCEECQLKKRKLASKGLVVKPIKSKDFNSRAQVDLVDMQSMKHGDYKFIMHYQDHLTKFSILRALKSKRAAEVAFQLLDIFLLFGAPHILQSDNGREFTANIITELKDLWPDCCIVHGKPRHPQSQGSVERANADIKDMLITWMRENESQSWSVGLKFVQFAKNNSYHSGIKRSSYRAMFGCETRMGLNSSALPPEIISTLQSEDDLLAYLDQDSQESDTCSQTTDDSQPDIDFQISDDVATEQLCVVCNQICNGAHKCSECSQLVHVICGTVNSDEGYGAPVICQLCFSEQNIVNERNTAVVCMEKQCQRMENQSKKF